MGWPSRYVMPRSPDAVAGLAALTAIQACRVGGLTGTDSVRWLGRIHLRPKDVR